MKIKTYLLTNDKNDAISISLKSRISCIDEIIDIFDNDWLNTISNGECYIDWRLLKNPTDEFCMIYAFELSSYPIIILNQYDCIEIQVKNDF